MTDPALPVVHRWIPFPDEPTRIYGVTVDGDFCIENPDWPMHKASPSPVGYKLAQEIARMAQDTQALEETIGQLREEMRSALEKKPC